LYSPQLVVELTRVLAMEIDAVRAYANAVALLGPGPIRDELGMIGQEHQAHVAAIRNEISYRGYLPPEHTASVDGIVLGGGPVTAPPGPEETLHAVRRNELLAASLYAKILAKGPPDGARELLERLRGEAERHRSWAERTLARRPWETAGAGAP
jgi:rubrerythrin